MARQYKNFCKFLTEIKMEMITNEKEYVNEMNNSCKNSGKRYVDFQYKCERNHISSIRNTAFVNKICNWRQGKIPTFCAFCSTENANEICNKNYYDIAENLGYKILEIKDLTITFVCKCGNTTSVPTKHFVKRTEDNCCIKCLNDKNRVELSIVLKTFQDAGLEPLDITEYKSNKQKLACKHTECGNIATMSLSDIRKGRICNVCNRVRAEETNLEKYGARNPFASEEIKLRIKKTHLEKYGVEHHSQNYTIWKKIVKSSFRAKNYQLKPDLTIYIMGYEGFCLDILLGRIKTNYQGPFYTENDIITEPSIPSVTYIDEIGKKRMYYPDIFLPDKTVEVKSIYTFNKFHKRNHCKAVASSKIYSEFEIWILSKEKVLVIIVYKNEKGYFKHNNLEYSGKTLKQDLITKEYIEE